MKKIRVVENKLHLGGNIIGGDSNTFYPELWSWLINRYNIKSVFDVGCGEGHALYAFKSLGCDVFGIDGVPENIDSCKELAAIHDITDKIFYLNNNVDLIWCCELVEHISEEYLSNLLYTLTQGTYIAMTHAIPKQRGYHHVNCKDDQYWISAICNMQYSYLKDDSELSRSIFLTYQYWAQSGLIFKKND